MVIGNSNKIVISHSRCNTILNLIINIINCAFKARDWYKFNVEWSIVKKSMPSRAASYP